VNVNDLTIAQKAELNNNGIKYGLGVGEFMNYLDQDAQERDDIRLAKLEAEEKLTMSVSINNRNNLCSLGVKPQAKYDNVTMMCFPKYLSFPKFFSIMIYRVERLDESEELSKTRFL